jgi:radical SAM superfamily enzyme YgiQ (UPF0313 family)
MQIFWFSCAPSVTGYRSNLIFAFVCILYFSASTHDFRAALFMGRPSPTKSPDTKHDFRQQAAARLRAETGTIYKRGQTRVALLKPSTYFVSMSSLGFQQIYRILNDMPDVVAERAFLPDDPEAFVRSRSSLFTYESGLAVGDCEIIGVSIAYELEITGLLRCLELSGVPLWASERSDSDPIVMLGGPLTFSNPLPASPFADVVLMGEAEDLVIKVVEAYQAASSRAGFLEVVAQFQGAYVPSIHGERLVAVAKARDEILPAYSIIRTADTELSNMHLVESERGCHRKCTFCVMRRSTNGGMRLASPEAIMATVPADARKVGLVGAAASDHPRIVDIIKTLVDAGKEVSLSSLRADRLTPAFVEQLCKGGARTLTIASDGASERLRAEMEKNIKEKHILRTAELAAQYGIRTLKLYMMIGVPNETLADIDELITFCQKLSQIIPVAMGVAPFVSKRNTPLDRLPFAGIKEVERTMDYLRKGLKGVVDIRATSARWAWVEYQLAQGGFEMAHAAVAAYRGGEDFAAWKRAITEARKERPVEVVPGWMGLPQAAPLSV